MSRDSTWPFSSRGARNRSDDNTLLLGNVNSKYTERSMASWPVDIDNSKHDWVNYFLAGYRVRPLTLVSLVSTLTRHPLRA